MIVKPVIAKDPWYQVTSDNFIITGDAEPAIMKGLVEDLETFREFLQLVTNVKDTTQDQPFRIFVFKNARSYQKEVKVPGSAGVFRGRLNGSAAFLDGDTDREAWELAGKNVLFHEYVHHFLRHFSPLHYPRWYSEGFAEFLATFEVADGRMIVGKPPMWRMFAVRGDDWIPMDRLLDSNVQYQSSRDGLSIFYGQSWLLVHYTQLDDDLKPKMAEYLSLVNLGVENEEALQRAFGKTPKQLMNDLRQYWKSQRMQHLIYNIPDDYKTPEVDLRALSDEETRFYKAYIYSYKAGSKSGFRRFEKEINRLLKKYPDYLPAHLLMAELTLIYSDGSDVAGLLEPVIDAEPENIAAQAILGAALINLASHSDDPGQMESLITQGRTILNTVLNTDSDNFLANYFYGLSYIYLNPDQSSAGIEMLEFAQTIHPEFPLIQLMAARAMIVAGQNQAATAYLLDIVTWALSSSLRETAEELLESIGSSLD